MSSRYLKLLVLKFYEGFEKLSDKTVGENYSCIYGKTEVCEGLGAPPYSMDNPTSKAVELAFLEVCEAYCKSRHLDRTCDPLTRQLGDPAVTDWYGGDEQHAANVISLRRAYINFAINHLKKELGYA